MQLILSGSNTVVACGLTAGGRLTRTPNQNRIDFLAEARNRALEPLWLNTSFPGSTMRSFLAHLTALMCSLATILKLLSVCRSLLDKEQSSVAHSAHGGETVSSCAGEGGLPSPREESRGSHWSLHDLGVGQAKPLWQADRVIFLNDVYFCARDIVRLLQHDADMVCGMDFDRPRLQDASEEVRSV